MPPFRVGPLRPLGVPAAGVRPPGAGGLSALGQTQARLNELNRLHGTFTVKPPAVQAEMAGLNKQLLELSQAKPVLNNLTLNARDVVVASAENRQLSPQANALVKEFVARSQGALAEPNFDVRNMKGAEGIAKQAAAFASAAIAGNGKIEGALYDVFRDTVVKGSDGLAVGFTAQGPADVTKLPEFEAALVKGREVTAEAMPRMLAVLDEARGVPVKAPREYQLEVQQTLRHTRLDDMAEMLASELKVAHGKSGQQLKQELGIIVPEEDSRKADISRIVLRRPGEAPTTDREKEVLDLKNRLEHAVSLGQQIHRAAFGDGVRPDMQLLDPVATQGRFDAYDSSLVSTYTQALKTNAPNAFTLALWERYKQTWPK